MSVIHRLTIENYRSIRKLSVPLRQLNVFVGENGAGKTNLYRALELIQAAALGTLTRELAAEGGMESAFWAGERKAKPKEPKRIKLGCVLGEDGADFAYGAEAGLVSQRVEMGVASLTGAGFAAEPQIKVERLEHLSKRRPITLLKRDNMLVTARDRDGVMQDVSLDLLPSETALGAIRDPGRFPDLAYARDHMSAWRFHHSFRTDTDSPLRRPCLAITTPTLAPDGADLAAAFATLAHIREDTVDLDVAIADAFEGAQLHIPEPGRMASFGMTYSDFPGRVFDAAELSDGTLRFLALAGALFSYRPASFIALNEPETSLHPDLLPALGRLIARAAQRSQLWIVTHSDILARVIADETGIQTRRIVKVGGETRIEGLGIDGEFEEGEA